MSVVGTAALFLKVKNGLPCDHTSGTTDEHALVTQVLCLGIKPEDSEAALEVLAQTSDALSNAVPDEDHSDAVYTRKLSLYVKQAQSILASPASLRNKSTATGARNAAGAAHNELPETRVGPATPAAMPAGEPGPTPVSCPEPENPQLAADNFFMADGEVGWEWLEGSVWNTLFQQETAADWLSSSLQLDPLLVTPMDQPPVVFE